MFSPVGPYAGLGRFAGYPAGQSLGSAGLLQPSVSVAGAGPYYPRVAVAPGLVHPGLYSPANLHIHNMCRHLTSGKDLADKELKASPMAHYGLLLDPRPLAPLQVATSRRDPLDCGLDLSHRGPAPEGRSPAASERSSTDSPTSSPLNFSIDSILGRDRGPKKSPAGAPQQPLGAGRARGGEEMDWAGPGEEEEQEDGPNHKYSWLQCTRYKPPKLPRSKKKEGGKKRKLGRNPRVPFTQHQVVMLEQKFRHTHYLSSVDVAELSAKLNLTETRVKIWFQNRRARERRDRDGCLPSSGPAAVLRGEPGQDPGALSPATSPRDGTDLGKGPQSPVSPTSNLHVQTLSDLHSRLPLTLGGGSKLGSGKALGLGDLEALSWHAKTSAFTPVVRLPS